MGDTVPRPSINDLPHEMLEQLLQYIPTSDLLFNCRLVCQVWSELATTICGNREVIVKPSTHLDYFSEAGFRQLFMTPSSIRWTGVDLTFTDSPQVKAFNAHLCEDFGTRILYLSAKILMSAESDFFDALRQMPNLQQLHFCVADGGGGPYVYDDEFQPFIFPQHGEIQLPQLKKLQLSHLIYMYSQYFELLEFLLLRTGAQLESLDLPYLNVEVMASDLEEMAELLCIADIPNLSLELWYYSDSDEFYDLMGRQQYRIHSLKIEFYHRLDNLPEDRSTFRPLERFLNNSIGLTILRLGHFEYIGSIMSNVVSRFLQSIMLPDLKTLGMTLHYDDTNSGHENPMFTVHPVRSASFPNLKKFDLFYLPSDQESLDIELIFELNTFNTVKYLKVDYQENGRGIRGMFSSVFQNTTKIRVKICSLGQISSVLKGMKHVENLYIELDSINEDELLSEAVEYIGPLKTLRVFTLDVSSSTKSKLELSQIGALALMQLRPLSLIIYGSKLKNSDAAVLSLREYHFGVKILPTSVKR